MVFDYNAKESERFLRIQETFHRKSVEIMERLQGMDPDSAEYRELYASYVKLSDSNMKKRVQLSEQAAERYLDSFNEDVAALVEEAKRQAGLEIDLRIRKLARGYGGQYRPRKEEDPEMTATETEAIDWIRYGIRPITTRLKDNPEALNEIWAWVFEFVKNNEHVEKTEKRLPLPDVTKYTMLNDKVSRYLLIDDMFYQDTDGQITLRVNFAPNDPAKQIISYVSLTFEGTQTSKKITGFDNSIYNTLATLTREVKRQNDGIFEPFFVTTNELWRVTNGLPSKEGTKKPSQKQRERIRQSMDKLRTTLLYINFKEEIKANYIKVNENDRLSKGEIDENLIFAKWVSFETEKGQTVEGYKIMAEPILYTYNAAKGHYLLINNDLLDTSATTGNEGYTVEFRDYLLKELFLMEIGKRDSNRILFDTLYKCTGVKPPAERLNPNDYADSTAYKRNVRKESAKDKNKIFELLEAWKQKGYLKDYEPVKKGSKRIGVDITFPETNKPKKQIEKK